MFVRKGNAMYGNPNSLPGLGGNGGQRRFQQRPQPAPTPQPPRFSQPAPMPMPDTGSARRIDALEQRLMAAEQANRSLLDELMRMQQETKVNVKKNEHSLTEERDGRGRLEMAMRATQGKMAELEERQGRTEAALKESRSAIQSLVMHTKNVERAVMTSSGETRDRRDQTMSRLQELRHEVSGLNQSKDALDRMTHTLREDVRDLHMKVETLQGDVQAVDHTMKLQTRMMEEGSRKNMQAAGSGGGMNNAVAMALEAKVVKLQQNVMDVNSRLVHDAKNRDMSEQQQNERINDVWSELGEVKRRREDDLRELELKTREMSSMTGSEKKRLQMTISSIQNDLETKLKAHESASRGDKMQGETGERVRQLERSLEEEVTARTTREKALRDEVEKKLDEIKVYSDEGLNGIRKMTEAQQEQTRQRFKELSDGLNLLEGSFNEDKLETEQKLNKEAQERENLENVMDAKVDDLSDRLRIGMASLQSALGEASSKGGSGSSAPGLSIEEIERLQNSNNEGVREQMAKSIAEVDSKIAALRTRVEQQDEVIENKVKQAERSDDNESNMMGDKLTQKMDSITFAQERLKRQVDQLEDTVKECPRDIAEVKEQLQETESRLNKKLEQETRDRTEDIEDVRRDLGRLAGTDESAGGTSLARVQQDVDDTQTSVTKLAEAMQIIKVTLSEKVKEEKKMREQETEVLKRDVERLDTKTRDLKDRIKHPKAYKKKKQGGGDDAAAAAVAAGAAGLGAEEAAEAATELDDLGLPVAEEEEAAGPGEDQTSAAEGDGEAEPEVTGEETEQEAEQETQPEEEPAEEKPEDPVAPEETQEGPEDGDTEKEDAAEPDAEGKPDEEETKPEDEPEKEAEQEEAKPEEEKPDEDDKPDEKKPEEEKPEEEKQDEGTKPEEEPKPEAEPEPDEDGGSDEPPPTTEDSGDTATDPAPAE